MSSIFLSAPICKTGYGIASYNFAKTMIDMGQSVMLFPIGSVDPDMSYLTGNYVSKRANSLRIWHQNDVHPRIGTGKHFGFPIFELNKFTDIERRSMSLCDTILVCSEWAKRIVEEHVHIDVQVVPLGVDTSLFRPVEEPTSPVTTFINVGKWEIRKGHDFLIHCFKKAFSSRDPVRLNLVPSNPFLTQQQVDEWHRMATHEKIRIFPRIRHHERLMELMAEADVGVFPARAEGWNLELLEMMALGKHVIATDYSGHTEFANSNNCRLINVPELETAVDDVWFHGQGQWAKLDTDAEEQMIFHMRECHQKKQSGSLGVNTSGIETANQFSWINSTKILLNRLNE